MTAPDFAAARAYALGRLASELPGWMEYHSLEHTRDVVGRAAERLAAYQLLPERERELLLTAAAFHDVGFVLRYAGHEAAGAEIAQQVLPGYGLSVAEVQAIVGMILATRLPQSPQNHLEKLMADADLAVLGMDDFLPRNTSLRREMAVTGRLFSDAEWYHSQVRFIQNHQYFTSAARALFDAKKAENLAALSVLASQLATV